MFDPKKANHQRYVESLSKKSAEARSHRKLELELAEQEGRNITLTRAEIAEKAQKEIKMLEEKYGIDGHFPNEPQVRAVYGSTAQTAWNPGTLKELIY